LRHNSRFKRFTFATAAAARATTSRRIFDSVTRRAVEAFGSIIL